MHLSDLPTMSPIDPRACSAEGRVGLCNTDAMPRQHVDPVARDLRRQLRARIGLLSLSRVTTKTQARYRAALGAFEVWTNLMGRSHIGTTEELDVVAISYIEALWAEGESRGNVGDLLSALQWALQ